MRRLLSGVFVFLIPPCAAAFDSNQKVTAPIDLRTIVPGQRRFEFQQLPNLDIRAMSRFELERLRAIAPIQTVEVPAGAVAGAVLNANGQGRGEKKSVTGSLGSFAGHIAKDQQQGGDQIGSLSGTFFDATMTLPETMEIPRPENTSRIVHEIEAPPEILRAHGIQATVAVYGSARTPSPEEALAFYKQTVDKYGRKPRSAEGREQIRIAREAIKNSRYYAIAERFGELVARGGRGKIALVTGGGPGTMKAANRGAFNAGGPSVGFNIKLEHEQELNEYVTPRLAFEFENFPTRQMNMRHGALAMVYFPGGFGTMYEFFEVLTLMQTGKIARRPIVLVGEKAYWDQILDFEKFAKMGMIAPQDLKLFRYVETAEEAWDIVREQSRPRALKAA